MLAGAHKKFYRVQHAEMYLLDLKAQYKHKMKLSLAMVSKHILLYLCLPDYIMNNSNPDNAVEKPVRKSGLLLVPNSTEDMYVSAV